jgi:hypothetical protein
MNTDNLLYELQSKRNYILGKMENIRQCIRAGIGSVEIIVKDPINRQSFYFTEYDMPFNLQLEASILFWDALDAYGDQLAEIEYQINELNETKVDNIRRDI